MRRVLRAEGDIEQCVCLATFLMQIIAHRGIWARPCEKNTAAAFEKAIGSGFGIETDIRDVGGLVAISHDVPIQPPELFAIDLFRKWATRRSGVLALNVKSDGLQTLAKELIHQSGLSDYFFFDMSIPDAVGYLGYDLPIYTRQSDLEPAPCLYDKAVGVWIDGFHSDWWDLGTIEAHLKARKQVCIVSPELHGRPYLRMWDKLASAPWRDNDNVMLCTDHPAAAVEALK